MKAKIIMFHFLVFSLSLNLVSSKEEGNLKVIKKNSGNKGNGRGKSNDEYPRIFVVDNQKRDYEFEKRLIENRITNAPGPNYDKERRPGTKNAAIFESSDGKNGSNLHIKCFYVENYNVYSLLPLQKKNEDYKYDDTDGDGDLYFNFCKDTKYNSTFALDKSGKIIKLTGSIDPPDNNTKNQWSELENAIQIDFDEGDICNTATNEKYKLKLKIICKDTDDQEKLKIIKYHINENNPCYRDIEMESIYGCSLKSTYLLMKLFNDYSAIFGVAFILLGLMFCFLGYRFLKITIIVLSGIIGCYLITVCVLSFFPDFITSEQMLFICLGVSFILGCGIGFFLKGDIKTSILLLGGFLGYLCTDLVFKLVQNYVEYDEEILRYICMAVCILIGAFIGYKLNDPIIVLSTSVLGGYLTMRGLSLFLGHYPDEKLIIDLIKNKEWGQLKEMRDNWIYGYLGLWIVIAIVGIYMQCKNKGKKGSSEINK